MNSALFVWETCFKKINHKKTDQNNNETINKYQNFIPTNFYFEAPNEKTEFEILNNDDLNVFLSLLN